MVSPPAAEKGLADVVAILELAVLAYLTIELGSQPTAYRLIVRVVTTTSLVAAGAALAGVALFYLGVGTDLVGGYGALVPSSDYARAQGPLQHPAELGSYCIFASAVVAQGGDAISDRLRRMTQAVLALTVVLTFSRAVLGFALAAIIRSPRVPRLRAAAAAAAVLAVALMATLTVFKVSLDPSRPFDAKLQTDVESVRSQELRASVETFAEHPLFGTGPRTLPGEAAGYGPRQAHNTPVGVAATLGLPALVALIVLLVALWRGRERPTNMATWGGLAGLGVDGLGQDIENFRHVWVLIGLAGASPGREAEVRPAADAERRAAC